MKKSNVYRSKTIDRLSRKSELLGKDYNIILLLNLRIIICLLIFVIFALINYIGLIIGFLLAIIFYYFLECFFFDIRIVSRKKELENDALVFFNLLKICLQSKKGIFKSLEIVSNNLDSTLALEFRKVLSDNKNGKDLNDALLLLKNRVPSETVNNFIITIMESNNNSSTLVKSLDIQLKHLNKNLISNTKTKITLVPIKMNVLNISFLIILSTLIYYLYYLIKIA